jgi:hypothetical protein
MDWLIDAFQGFAVGVGLDVHRSVAQPRRKMPQAGHDQVGLGTVHVVTAQRGVRFDEQHRPVIVGQEVRAELIGEQPPHR